MKKMLPELVGTAGYGLCVAGCYLLWGAGVAMLAGGVALILGAFLASRGRP